MVEQELELRLLLEAIYGRTGYDFRGYSEASLRRRFEHVLLKTGDKSLSQLQHRVLHEPDCFPMLLSELTVTTSEMFRDPLFFQRLREQVIPMLRTFPTINVWHAGCSTGEEVYSLAILLHEEGLLERTTLYATDINQRALKQARSGIYPAEAMRSYTLNYGKSGGNRSFAEYYHAAYGAAQLRKELQANMVFSEHNLVTDSVFCETHLVLCRNVLIYFQRELQERVVRLFTQSLRWGGFLCLGSKESLECISARKEYDVVDNEAKIYRKHPAGNGGRRRDATSR